MGMLRFIVLLFFVFSTSCTRQQGNKPKPDHNMTPVGGPSAEIAEGGDSSDESKPLVIKKEIIIINKTDYIPVTYIPDIESSYTHVKGALLLTRFKSLEELKTVIQIEYVRNGKPMVLLTHSVDGREVRSILKSGISEFDIMHARDGGFWDRVWLGLNSPYVVFNRKELSKVYNLARRRYHIFGEGDVAFYDLSESILYNISDEDIASLHTEDLSEKGYFNTFNHITAQAFITSIFSEKLADFIADKHEIRYMPELITGKFTEAQLADLENGPIDNYVDLINNEWG